MGDQSKSNQNCLGYSVGGSAYSACCFHESMDGWMPSAFSKFQQHLKQVLRGKSLLQVGAAVSKDVQEVS